jgi:hypothetical protein
MISSDQIHVAMTKMSGIVATLTCQSNIFYQSKGKKTLIIAIAYPKIYFS